MGHPVIMDTFMLFSAQLEATTALYLNCPGNFQPNNRKNSATEARQNCDVLAKAQKTPE